MARKAAEAGVDAAELSDLVDAFLSREVPFPSASVPGAYYWIGKVEKVCFVFYTADVLSREAVDYGLLPILEIDPADYDAIETKDAIEEQLRFWGLDATISEEISDFVTGRLVTCGSGCEVVFRRSPESTPILISLHPPRW